MWKFLAKLLSNIPFYLSFILHRSIITLVTLTKARMFLIVDLRGKQSDLALGGGGGGGEKNK